MNVRIRKPFILQHDEKDCGVACFLMVAEYYGKKMGFEAGRKLTGANARGNSIYDIVKGADRIGLNAEAYEGNIEELIKNTKNKTINLPIIVRVVSEDLYEHFIVIYKIYKNSVMVGDPADLKIRKIKINDFEKKWLGQLIIFSRRSNFEPGNEKRISIIKYYKEIIKYKKIMILTLLASAFILLIDLSGAYLFRFILSNSHNTFFVYGKVIKDVIWKICAALIILYFFRMITEIIRSNLITVIAKKLDVSLTMKYYEHMLRLKMEVFNSRTTGDFVSRFFDTAKIREAISSVVIDAILDMVMGAVCGIILFKLNYKLFFVSLITIIAYSVVVIQFRNHIRRTENDMMAGQAVLTTKLKETVDGIQTIKAFNLEDNNIKCMYDLYNKLTGKIQLKTRVTNLQSVITNFITSVGIIVVLSAGYKEYLAGIISMADLFTFYYILNFFLYTISELISFQPCIEAAIIAADRLSDIMDIEEESNSISEELLGGDIIFDNVTFRYGYNDPVLECLNLRINSGEKVMIKGGNGTGKTTIAKLLMGFCYPESGDIYIGGTNIKKCAASSIRKNVSYISQDTFLFTDSIYNNLVAGNTEIDKFEIEEIVKRCGLMDFINKLPAGYDTLISEGGVNLSGGEKQRIAIARALINKRKIIIMDEPDSNLDSFNRMKFNETISNIKDDVTCLIISHNEEIANYCSKVIELK